MTGRLVRQREGWAVAATDSRTSDRRRDPLRLGLRIGQFGTALAE
jgi:hypothetical protein